MCQYSLAEENTNTSQHLLPRHVVTTNKASFRAEYWQNQFSKNVVFKLLYKKNTTNQFGPLFISFWFHKGRKTKDAQTSRRPGHCSNKKKKILNERMKVLQYRQKGTEKTGKYWWRPEERSVVQEEMVAWQAYKWWDTAYSVRRSQ